MLAIVVGTVVFLPAAFLFPWFAIAAIVILALFGNAVPATVIEDLPPWRALGRSIVVARADLVHALGGLATLVLMFGLGRLAMGFLLRQQADNTLPRGDLPRGYRSRRSSSSARRSSTSTSWRASG